MNCKLAVLGAGLALALAATTADAAVSVVSVKQNNLTGYNFTPTSLITFNNIAVGTPATFTTGGATFSSMPSVGGAFIENGTTPYAFMAPAGDTSNYLALGQTKAFSKISESITLSRTVNQFGFYWGSIDKYNTVSFLLNGVSVGSLSGTNVANFSSTDGIKFASNGVNTNASAYVSFGGAKFNQVVLSTTQPNFELDNVAIGGVPEASTWAMMLIGFGGLGGLMLHRRKTGRTNMAMVAA